MVKQYRIKKLHEKIVKFLGVHGMRGLSMSQYKSMVTQLNNLKRSIFTD